MLVFNNNSKILLKLKILHCSKAWLFSKQIHSKQTAGSLLCSRICQIEFLSSLFPDALCLLHLLAHTSAVTHDNMRLRAVPSHCFQNGNELRLLHSPEQHQPATVELQQMRICSPGILQIFADPRKSQNKKAWLQAQQSHLLDVSLQKCVFQALNIQSLITRYISTAQDNTERAFLA